MNSHVSREAVIDAISDELDKIDHVPQWVYDRLINRIKMLESAESMEFVLTMFKRFGVQSVDKVER